MSQHTKGDLNASCTGSDTNCTCGCIFDQSERCIAKALHGEAGTNGFDPDITVEEMKANAARLALCWNSHEPLKAALQRIIKSSFYGSTTGYQHVDPDAITEAQFLLATLDQQK